MKTIFEPKSYKIVKGTILLIVVVIAGHVACAIQLAIGNQTGLL